MILEYKVVKDINSEVFETRVNNFIQEGFSIQGSIVVTRDPINGKLQYSQAIIKQTEQTLKEYKLVKDINVDHFEKRVNKVIKEGFEPVGLLIVTRDPTNGKLQYSQVLIKR